MPPQPVPSLAPREKAESKPEVASSPERTTSDQAGKDRVVDEKAQRDEEEIFIGRQEAEKQAEAPMIADNPKLGAASGKKAATTWVTPVVVACIVLMFAGVGAAYFIVRRRARANHYQVDHPEAAVDDTGV